MTLFNRKSKILKNKIAWEKFSTDGEITLLPKPEKGCYYKIIAFDNSEVSYKIIKIGIINKLIKEIYKKISRARNKQKTGF